MNWKRKAFKELNATELYAILLERTQVFVVEQNCPYLEVDGRDPKCEHIFCEKEGEIVAYLRLLPPGISGPAASIGRVLVKQDYRGQNLGRELVRRGIEILVDDWKEAVIKIQAQDYLRGFYESFGFVGVSDVYLEDNIPHIDMVLNSNPQNI